MSDIDVNVRERRPEALRRGYALRGAESACGASEVVTEMSSTAGFSLASKAGLRFALISGESSPQVDRFAAKMKIADVYKGCCDKRAALEDFMSKHGLTAEQVCFVGDDVNDIPALKCAGLPVAVGTANQSVFAHADYRTQRPGGDGAVREVLDLLLSV